MHGCFPCMRLVPYKYRQNKTISRTGLASAETIYDSAICFSSQEGRLSNRWHVEAFFLKSLLRVGGP
ncbi:hypothetical protein EMIT0P43_30171 [Pseudomonas jessenii]